MRCHCSWTSVGAPTRLPEQWRGDPSHWTCQSASSRSAFQTGRRKRAIPQARSWSHREAFGATCAQPQKKTIRTAARLAPIRTTIRSRVALNACHQRETPDQRRPPEHGHVSVQKRSEAATLRLPGEPLLSMPPPLQPVTSSCLEQIPMRNADESYRLEMPVRKANERLLPHYLREATSWPLVRPISLAAEPSCFFLPPRLSVCPKPAR